MSSMSASTQQYPSSARKRVRIKSVSWAAEDKLNQVRLFAAEDAPSLSGSVLQDLLEAKRSKFMHSTVPVSDNDLPPGFEIIATKRGRLDTPTMVTQLPWRYPERFTYDPSWQVSIGDESTEAVLQTQREVRVLEAIYPRLTAIPASPAEPQEIPPGSDDAVVPHIPLIPIEDEEETMEDDHNSKGGTGSTIKFFSPPASSGVSASSASMSASSSQGSASRNYPPGYSPPRDDKKSVIEGAQSGVSHTDFATAFLKNAGPDVAAAAAAAYAVLKAKESGALIDHDLLIKILNNPLLIETLTASNPSLSNQFPSVVPNMQPPYRVSMNGNGLKIREPPFVEGGAHMIPSNSAQIMQARQSYESNPTWGPVAANALGNLQGRVGIPSAGEGNAVHRLPGQAYINPSHSYPLPRHDIPRELIQPNAMAGMLTNEAPFRPNSAPMMSFEGKTLDHDLEQRVQMHASSGSIGGQPWPGSSNVLLTSLTATSPQDRAAVGPKIKKQCFFFNTPKGCRNGAFCNFLHGTVVPEKHENQHERTTSNPDAGVGMGSGMQTGISTVKTEESE